MAREIEASTSKIKEKQRIKEENMRKANQTSIRNFEIETLISYLNISYESLLVYTVYHLLSRILHRVYPSYSQATTLLFLNKKILNKK